MEDLRSSEIVGVTIIDEDEHEREKKRAQLEREDKLAQLAMEAKLRQLQKEEELAQFVMEAKLAALEIKKELLRSQESLYEVSERAVTQVLLDVDHIEKRLDKHSSDRPEVGRGGGSSGFYKVPEVMRRRARGEAAALYDPKHVNLWKIRELFEKKDDPGGDDVETLSQIRHYFYHLRSCAERMGWKDNTDSLMWDLCAEFNSKVMLDSRSLWANIFLCDLLIRSSRGELSATDDPECAHLWVSELWADLLLLENQIPLTPSIEYDFLALRYFEDFIPLSVNWPISTNYYHILDFIHYMLLPMTSHSKPGSRLLGWFRSPKEARSMKAPSDEWWLNAHTDLTSPSRTKMWFRSHTKEALSRMKSVLAWLWSHTEEALSRMKSVIAWLWSPIIAWFRRPEEIAPSTMKPIPTATRLQQAGIKFKPVDYEGFVVEFKRGVLKLPRLQITKCTKKVLMNLIAWEICHNKAPKYFINYAIFMDHLINTAKDVDILIQSGVFEHSLATDEEVAALFNSLSQDLVYTKNEPENKRYDIFPKLSLDIKKYCKSRRNVWLANLMQDYFKSPWSIISLIAALFLILLTLMQTFFSAYSYFRPPK